MVVKQKNAWRARLSSIMHNAWTFFKRGLLSFSLSLKIAWKLDKREVTMTQLNKQFGKLFKR